MTERPRWKDRDIEEDREEQCVDTCPLHSTGPLHSFYALIYATVSNVRFVNQQRQASL